MLYHQFDIVRNGRFELPGFAFADFDVTVRIPGVGVCVPVRVELRKDSEIEFVVVPQRDVTVSVHNAKGELIPSAKLVRDEGIVRAPKRYGVTGAALVKLVYGSYQKQKPVSVPGGTIELGVPVGEGVAFYVDAPGYLRAAAAVAEQALTERIDVVMLQAGSVRGVVHGGMRKAYAGYVSVTALDATGNEIVNKVPRRNGSLRKVVASALINQQGSFVLGNIAPGSYRAQVSRSNTRTMERESQGVPLIDGFSDARATTDFVVEAGNETNIELTEPPLGRLIGRVLLRSTAVVGAVIVAARPVAKASTKEAQNRYGNIYAGGNWDDTIELGYVPGQRSGNGGEFMFLYRDAGLVEVRVRHVDGLTTSRAFVVELPPPGADVVRDFEIPAGEIRGRYPFEQLHGDARKTFTVTLFPPSKTLHDPFFHPHHGSSLAWDCPKLEQSADGSFAFRYLRSGRWLVRVHHSGGVLLWQKLVDVYNDVVDVGDLPAIQPVAADVKWIFAAKQPGKVLGVWLRVPQANDLSPIWAGTFAASKGGATCRVMPGKYLVSAFGRRTAEGVYEESSDMMSLGLTGEELTKPVPIEVHADGSVTPKSVAFRLTKVEGK